MSHAILSRVAGFELRRLPVDHPVHLLATIVAVVARGAALVVLEQRGVRIVDSGRGEVGADLEVVAGEGREVLWGVELLDGHLDPHLVQLAGHERGEVEVDR